jgi:N6-adenosine-specific RNA methylase IME4|tara:strand:+ start:53 stop:592 length:540 start_codon:yes stop_codon:yes gene_type:complete
MKWNNQFNIVYADPPWTFKNYNDKKSNHNANHHYPCMNMEDIKKIPVCNLAAKDCVLFMWCTDPLLNQQIEILSAWGFQYKTVAFYWIKENKNQSNMRFWKGPGYWTRANPEICLLATKGKPKRVGTNVDRLVIAKRDLHSKKPLIIRDKIVELCGDLPRIELFARTTAKGWSSWGNEV